MITNSLEWAMYRANLIRKSYNKVNNLHNRYQIKTLIANLDDSIKKLSIAEIQTRHGNNRNANELLEKINQDIEMVEEYILVAALIG